MSAWTDRIAFLREAGDVTRLHTVRTLRHHTVAAHSYGAMIIALELCHLNDLSRDLTLRVLTTLLQHDAAELETGDVPAPVKRAEPDVRAAYKRLEERIIVERGLEEPVLADLPAAIAKAADSLDLGYAAVEERTLGNKTPRVRDVLSNILRYTEAQLHVKGVAELRAYLATSWIAVEEASNGR